MMAAAKRPRALAGVARHRRCRRRRSRRCARHAGARTARTSAPRAYRPTLAAPADRDGHGVEARRLIAELEADGRLSTQRLDLVERVDDERARRSRPDLAGGKGVRVPLAPDGQLRATRADAVDLGLRRGAG